jgi:biotin carboxyl carrier protein
MKKLRVTVDGKSYDVTVEMLESPASAPAAATAPVAVVATASIAAAPAPVAPAAPAAGPAPTGAVPSPLAGKVVSIDVKPGQTVTEGQQLLTLEAMKMNTFVYASKAGTVAAVHVHPGDAVEEGAALLTLG